MDRLISDLDFESGVVLLVVLLSYRVLHKYIKYAVDCQVGLSIGAPIRKLIVIIFYIMISKIWVSYIELCNKLIFYCELITESPMIRYNVHVVICFVFTTIGILPFALVLYNWLNKIMIQRLLMQLNSRYNLRSEKNIQKLEHPLAKIPGVMPMKESSSAMMLMDIPIPKNQRRSRSLEDKRNVIL